ncbi:phage tail tape measure protein [Aeromonas veronii]|nr:phage tail tape measure protein [Aeromonas veronii]
MAKQLRTEITIDLAGNLAQKAKLYGQSMSQFATSNQRAMAMLNQTAMAASTGIDSLGNRAILAGAAVAYGFKKAFVDTAAEFERYQIMLNKLQGGPEGGAKAMEWIKQFTQDTPYAVDEVTSAFVKLKAFGLDPMNGTMQAIADQAAMMGGTAETVDGITLAFGQAWTKGKLQGEEALQLLERGVPVWDYLVKASKELGQNNGFGYSAQQIQDMASKGQLTRKAIQALIDQMGKASKGAARDQMNTWNGMISNMGDHWTLFKSDVMDSGAFSVLKSELGGLLSQLDEMKKTGEYDKLVEEVGGNLVDSFHAVSDAAKEVKNVGRELLPVLDGIGRGAKAISDAVGGYESLAKILASIYVINKGIRMAAPLAKGALAVGKGVYTAGSWAAGKISGRRGGRRRGGIGELDGMAESLASTLYGGAMPVYVVNMPGGPLGLPPAMDLPKGKNPKPIGLPKPNKPSINPKKLFSAAMLAPELPLALLYAASDSEAAKSLKAESDTAQALHATLPQPKMLSNSDAYAMMASGFSAASSGLPTNPYAMLAAELQKEAHGLSGGGNNPAQSRSSLDVTVHYDRPPTVRVRDVAPGMQVRVDNGPSLMP